MPLDLENVIRVTLTGPERGLDEVNKSALAIITDEAPIPANFGTSRQYLSPAGVAEDFGSNSDTYRMAVAVFSQNVNILSGRGFLVVIPRLQSAPAASAELLATATVNLSALTADDYNINVDVDGGGAADLLIGELDLTDLASAQTSLNSTAVTGAGLEFELSGELSAAQITLKTTGTGATKSISIGTASTGTDIAPVLYLTGSATGSDAGVERAKDAILRTAGSVNYFGIVYNEIFTGSTLTELAATVQTLKKFQAVASNLVGALTGDFTTIKNSGYWKTRCLLYTASVDDSIDFAAAYMSRLMCINFSGSNTALTMNLKDMVGFEPDDGISQTYLNQAKTAGVDVYANFGGIGKVYSNGANLFSDQVYTRLALQVDLQVAGFNFLATTSTKIPQTEAGMNGLKGAYREVLARHATAGVYAPGTWNSSTTFGAPEDHKRNIEEFGYFIYSLPLSQQAQSERESRIAPLIQIGAKEAGAIHSSDVSVFVEA